MQRFNADSGTFGLSEAAGNHKADSHLHKTVQLVGTVFAILWVKDKTWWEVKLLDQEIQIVRECILPHYAAQQKEDIIQELSKRMKERNLVNADFQEAVLKREQKYPTGLLIGKRNIAIPHTEPQYVKVPCIGIATLKKSVAFHRMDACDELVDVDVVLLLALNQAHAHMEMLSRIILMCQDEAFIEELLRAEQETDIEQIVRERLEGGKQHES